jgi:hypothetical protein
MSTKAPILSHPKPLNEYHKPASENKNEKRSPNVYKNMAAAAAPRPTNAGAKVTIGAAAFAPEGAAGAVPDPVGLGPEPEPEPDPVEEASVEEAPEVVGEAPVVAESLSCPAVMMTWYVAGLTVSVDLNMLSGRVDPDKQNEGVDSTRV